MRGLGIAGPNLGCLGAGGLGSRRLMVWGLEVEGWGAGRLEVGS